jgi:hypothetical protein
VKRREFLGAVLGAAAWPAHGAVAASGAARDFDLMWQEIDKGYAYFDDASRARWRRSRDRMRALAARATSPQALAPVLEAALAQLRDDHVTITGAEVPGRRIPYELAIWPRWRGGTATIEAVRTFGDADVAGLHSGQVITRVQGVPVEIAVREQLGGGAASAGDIEWALRRALAGPRTGVQKLEVREGGRSANVDLERTPPAPATTPAILGRKMGDQRDIGYIRVRVGAADPELASHFAGALGHMTGTRALILDLRDTAGQGSRDETSKILAHFARPDVAWQLVETRRKPRLAAYIDLERPGPAYPSPVAVLVNRWTAGEGESLAAGIAALAGARLVGTAMAGLRGELFQLPLGSGLVVGFPGRRTFTPGGTPRESLRPDVPVDLAAPSGGPGDPILYQALKLFERR